MSIGRVYIVGHLQRPAMFVVVNVPHVYHWHAGEKR